MHGSFENKVVPLTLYVLSVMDRIRSSDGVMPEQDEIRSRIKNLLGQFNMRGPRADDFALAKSAMVFWIDELLVNSEWQHAAEWRDNPLEREIYGSRSRAWKFFENADYARSLEQTDALETFGQCVALGFQGIYRSEGLRAAEITANRLTEASQADSTSEREPDTDETEVSEQHVNGQATLNGSATATAVLVPTQPSASVKPSNGKMPQTLSEWAAPVFAQLRGNGQAPFQPVTPSETPRDARPLSGKHLFFRWSVALLFSIAISIPVCVLAIKG